MKSIRLFSGLIWLTSLSISGSAQNAENTTPTWAEDIACIVYSHCTGCHRPGGIGPFPMMNYWDAHARRISILQEVEERRMPPWQADVTYQHHVGARVLSDEEIELIQLWVENDAPQGDPDLAPDPPVFANHWGIPEPDYSKKIPDYTIPPTVTDDVLRCFVLPTNEPGDRFIVSGEVIPGNREMVHHVLVFAEPSGLAAIQDALDPLPGYDCFGGIGSIFARLIGAWAPGATTLQSPPGMGIHLPRGTDIVVQIHYAPGSGGKTDSTRLNAKLSSDPLRPVKIDPILNHYAGLTNGPFEVPANTIKTFHEEFVFNEDVSFLGIGPHAHLICEYMEAYAVVPSGDTIPLVRIPHWDFHWQMGYQMRSPVHLPAGTVLHGIARYNNTSSNPHNPSDPPRDVSSGEGTRDEMMLFFCSYLPYEPGDELMVIDSSSHPDHYEGCNATITNVGETPMAQLQVDIFPNPVSDRLNIRLGQQAVFPVLMEVYDSRGQRVHRQVIRDRAAHMDVDPRWAAGLYNLQLLHPETRAWLSPPRKFLIR